jgi:hypothetical protein
LNLAWFSFYDRLHNSPQDVQLNIYSRNECIFIVLVSPVEMEWGDKSRNVGGCSTVVYTH